MKQLLQQYAAYNLWANKKLLDRLQLVEEKKLNSEIVGSFTSLFKTTLHMWNTESAWWQRLKLVEHVIAPGDAFKGSFNELADKLTRQSIEWELWVRGASEVALTHVFAYQNSKREQFKQPVYEMLLHLFNHQTYHRGQLVNQLRTVGEVEKIPVTDFIVYSRKK